MVIVCDMLDFTVSMDTFDHNINMIGVLDTKLNLQWLLLTVLLPGFTFISRVTLYYCGALQAGDVIQPICDHWAWSSGRKYSELNK